MSSTTLTLHLSDELLSQLAALADHTRRSTDELAEEALAGFVARELAIVQAIERGRADYQAGRVTPHDDVVRGASEIIAAARAKH